LIVKPEGLDELKNRNGFALSAETEAEAWSHRASKNACCSVFKEQWCSESPPKGTNIGRNIPRGRGALGRRSEMMHHPRGAVKESGAFFWIKTQASILQQLGSLRNDTRVTGTP
jgi:hypothetical protein